MVLMGMILLMVVLGKDGTLLLVPALWSSNEPDVEGTAILNGRLRLRAAEFLSLLSRGEKADTGDRGPGADGNAELALHQPCSLRLETGLTLISAV